jgi:predicted unusual protein kinase regulating ubiquinone biosynthesis (AarF/ABC1/UbiB family)/DNA-binding XRE family transcriptional regulator
MPVTRTKAQKSSEASRLRRLRDILGLTQREFAVEIKVAHGAIATWESGKQAMPGPVLKLLELYEEELGIGDAADGLSHLKTSFASRNFALSGAAGSAVVRATAMAFERMLANDERRNAITRRAHLAIGRRLVETLGELKGAAMKLGQTLGYLDFGISDEARAELASLQVMSRPMSPSAIASVFLEEFGEPPRRLFAEWTPQPFAAASIGQVHRARLRSGEEVAVKVQYPNIVAAIETDLRGAALVDTLSSIMFRGQERGTVIAEMRERFSEECDYRIEAENQEKFRRAHAGCPGLRIPRVYGEFTRRRVLVTSLERGDNFDTFLGRSSAAERNRAAATIWKFVIDSVFCHHMAHVDPHPGNFLFADGDVIVLDFGCVKNLPADLMSDWRDVLRAAVERRNDAVRNKLLTMGFVRDPQRYDLDAHCVLLLTFYEPWLTEQPFTFTPEFAARTWNEAMTDNPNKFRVNLPRDWVFINRMQFGLYGLLGKMGASGDFREPMMRLLYAPGEPRPAPIASRELALLRGRG